MIYIEIITVILLTLLNGLFAMSEFAVVSSRKSRLEHMANNGSKGARAALRLVDDHGRFLSTIQIGITLNGIIAGAYSGATLGQRLGAWLDSSPAIAPHGIAAGVSIMVLCITYLSLIFGELVPKRIALARPETIAAFAAKPMLFLLRISAPIVWILHVSTEKVIRLMGLSALRESTVTEDEVKMLIDEGTKTGVFVPQEKEMLEGVLRLADRPVRFIMTPRTHVVWIDSDAGWDALRQTVENNRLSRFLVCKETIDSPVGVVHAKDLLPEAARSAGLELEKLLRPPIYVFEITSVLQLLGRFKKEKTHLAVVVDEYGTTQGIVTLTDVIEAIAGDLPEMGENDAPRIVQRDDGSWLVDGTLPTDEVAAATGINMGATIKMTAGFMLENLGRIPDAGVFFTHENARFEVVDMDGNRIDKILIQLEGGNPGLSGKEKH